MPRTPFRRPLLLQNSTREGFWPHRACCTISGMFHGMHVTMIKSLSEVLLKSKNSFEPHRPRVAFSSPHGASWSGFGTLRLVRRPRKTEEADQPERRRRAEQAPQQMAQGLQCLQECTQIPEYLSLRPNHPNPKMRSKSLHQNGADDEQSKGQKNEILDFGAQVQRFEALPDETFYRNSTVTINLMAGCNPTSSEA